ncbi:uncharacterized protein [Rutidosis leptorrhynchoides]|uniref:uncharacterized protein isoform X2 n=1 Tax=Rutidosis leptorrhynchoides TaxID=125765 RepID=UPI003A9A0C8D
MSRCFPFPPPGYEKKFTTDERDLLKKDKRKEKKHKKDKKDTEKKEGKEKRVKDKHRDKKKDKDQSKTSTPHEIKINEHFGALNGNQLHNINEQKKETSSITDDEMSYIRCPDQNGDLVRNKNKPVVSEKDKFVQELDRRIREEEKGMSSHQFVVDSRKNNVNGIEIENTGARQSVINGRQSVMDGAGSRRNMVFHNRINGSTPPPFDNNVDRVVDQKLKVQEKGSDDKRGDKQKNRDRDKQHGKEKDMEKEKRKEKSEQKKSERDKNRQIKNNDFVNISYNLSTHMLDNSLHGVGSEGNLKKRRDMETNGGSHENELRPNKMARPISNIPQENGRKPVFPQQPGLNLLDKQGASLNSFKTVNKGGQRVNDPIASPPISVSAKKAPISAFNHAASDPSPIKSPPVITNHVAAQSPPLVPTTKTQPNQFSAHKPRPQPQPLFGYKPPPAVVDKVAVPPQLPIPRKKSPHPDTKYLNQVLSVPKLEEWCGFDDQKWLFSNKTGRPISQKPSMEEVQVWSEAKHIESVDVCALPYVIPY